MTEKPKVTVYTPSHNYGRFLRECVDSMITQSFQDWELLIILDGAVDDSEEIAREYELAYPDKIIVLKNEEKQGLQTCANMAINAARGDYIVRLDSDDYFDESALLVLSNYLDNHPQTALVYPNYIYVDEGGKTLEMDSRKKIGSEVALLDLPAHGACTMIRKRVLKSIGGYNEDFTAQDGYDIWLRVARRYPVGNVSTPLFYYRQHGSSLTRNEERILTARENIKRFHAKADNDAVRPKVAVVIGAKGSYTDMPDIALQPVGGRPLIDYTLEAVKASSAHDWAIVSTDDPKVAEYCDAYDGVETFIRDPELSSERVRLAEVIHDSVQHLENDFGHYPDIVIFLNIHAPLRAVDTIEKAVNTLLLFNTDSVVGVYENFDLHYTHGKQGLLPLATDRHHQLRIEREALYTDNRAVIASWREIITEDDAKGMSVGHLVMPKEQSIHIKSPFDVWLLDKILSEKPGSVFNQNEKGKPN